MRARPRRDRAAVAGRDGVRFDEGDPFLVGVGVVDRGAERGRFGAAGVVAVAGAAGGGVRGTIPARPVMVERRNRRAGELDEREVRAGVLGPEVRAGVELREAAVAALAALGASRHAAGGVLVVPVDDERGRVAGVDTAVVGGHEEHLLVLGGVVEQRAGAEGTAAGGDHAHRPGDLAPLGPGGLRGQAGDVHVAGARLGLPIEPEAAVTLVHRAELELESGHLGGRQQELDHEIPAGHHRRPELAVLRVVRGGERPHHVLLIGGVDEQPASRRHPVAGEAEVERDRSRGPHPQPPDEAAVGEPLPGAALGRGDPHRFGDREAGRQSLRLPLDVLGPHRVEIERRGHVEVDRVERRELEERRGGAGTGVGGEGGGGGSEEEQTGGEQAGDGHRNLRERVSDSEGLGRTVGSPDAWTTLSRNSNLPRGMRSSQS